MRRPHLRRRRRQWLRALGVLAVAVPTLAHAHSKPTIPAAKSGETMYQVKDGDTLGAIAKRFRVRVRALIEANRLQRPDLLHPGQRLVIPLGDTNSAPRAATPPSYFVLTVPVLDGRVPVFRWPLEGPISSPFGRRRSGWHAGIDIKAEVGTPILAAADGTVSYSGWEKFFGRVVKIVHANGFVTVYAHNLQNFVETGEAVEAGRVIGTVGRTGRASAYHLHFEIWNQGRVFNPLFLLPRRDLQFVADGESQEEEAP